MPWLPWVAALAVAATVFGLILVRAWPSGGESAPVTASNDPCAGGVCAAEPEQLAAVTDGTPPPEITGHAAAVLEGSCGTLLYGANAGQQLPPASLTKIATALVTVDRAQLADIVDVHVNSALLVESTSSTVMGLEPGQELSVEDLLYGLLLPSGNDAAIALAEYAGGSVPAFVSLMNRTAQELGLEDTHFANPHGLDEPAHYTSAYDIAQLGRALLANPELAAIVRTPHHQPAWDGPEVWNGNELLTVYPDAIGVKIGYTEKAGQTIVAAAERDGRRLIVSVLGSSDRYSDAIALFEWAYAHTTPAC